MKIRFRNPFLAFVGCLFGVYSFFTPSLFPSFMFGVCFGLIYLNYKEEKNANNENN